MRELTDMPNTDVTTPDATFQTQVLVSLAEIKGSISLMNDRHVGTVERLEEHRNDIQDLRNRQERDIGTVRKEMDDLRTSHSRMLGASIALAFIIPIIVTILGWFIVRP